MSLPDKSPQPEPSTVATRPAAPRSVSPADTHMTQLKASLRGHDFSTQVQMLSPEHTQRKDGAELRNTASKGISGSGGKLPYAEQIQRSFGGYDISNVQAHSDGSANDATRAMGAAAYASGNHVVLGDGGKDLHTVAHEAAHVVQQQQGVSLAGGIGKVGDPYEQHADAVADLVVQGKSAEGLLGQMAGGSAQNEGVQLHPSNEAAPVGDVKPEASSDAFLHARSATRRAAESSRTSSNAVDLLKGSLSAWATNLAGLANTEADVSRSVHSMQAKPPIDSTTKVFEILDMLFTAATGLKAALTFGKAAWVTLRSSINLDPAQPITPIGNPGNLAGQTAMAKGGHAAAKLFVTPPSQLDAASAAIRALASAQRASNTAIRDTTENMISTQLHSVESALSDGRLAVEDFSDYFGRLLNTDPAHELEASIDAAIQHLAQTVAELRAARAFVAGAQSLGDQSMLRPGHTTRGFLDTVTQALATPHGGGGIDAVQVTTPLITWSPEEQRELRRSTRTAMRLRVSDAVSRASIAAAIGKSSRNIQGLGHTFELDFSQEMMLRGMIASGALAQTQHLRTDEVLVQGGDQAIPVPTQVYQDPMRRSQWLGQAESRWRVEADQRPSLRARR